MVRRACVSFGQLRTVDFKFTALLRLCASLSQAAIFSLPLQLASTCRPPSPLDKFPLPPLSWQQRLCRQLNGVYSVPQSTYRRFLPCDGDRTSRSRGRPSRHHPGPATCYPHRTRSNPTQASSRLTETVRLAVAGAFNTPSGTCDVLITSEDSQDLLFQGRVPIRSGSSTIGRIQSVIN